MSAFYDALETRDPEARERGRAPLGVRDLPRQLRQLVALPLLRIARLQLVEELATAHASQRLRRR